MTKKKSILFECNDLNCDGKWKIGFNRINKDKYTPCPKCGKKVLIKQKVIGTIEKDEMKLLWLRKNLKNDPLH